MAETFMIYRANGYTAELTARLAVEQGMRPILSGRSPEKFADLVKERDLPTRGFSLDNPTKAAEALADVPVVLHCAWVPCPTLAVGMFDSDRQNRHATWDIPNHAVVP